MGETLGTAGAKSRRPAMIRWPATSIVPKGFHPMVIGNTRGERQEADPASRKCSGRDLAYVRLQWPARRILYVQHQRLEQELKPQDQRQHGEHHGAAGGQDASAVAVDPVIEPEDQAEDDQGSS